MATDKLCRGEQCPFKKQCILFKRWLQAICDGNVHAKCVSKCPDGKWFVRDDKSEHPQHRH